MNVKNLTNRNNLITLKEQEYYQQINPDTGEVIGDVRRCDVVIKEVPRTGFAITYLSTIINLIDNIGNRKMQVVKYILQKMDSNNKLSETVREIAAGSGCSLQTVNNTLKILEECEIIARKTGTVMLSPKLAHKGNAAREKFLMLKFTEIKSSENNTVVTASETVIATAGSVPSDFVPLVLKN